MTRLTQQHHHLHLGSGALATGKFERSRLLLVRRGHVWITQEGRPEDFWLSAGDALIVQPGKMVVIEAAIASEIYLEHRAELTLPLWLKTRCLAMRSAWQRRFGKPGRFARTGLAPRRGGY
ncbi:DUF2917 domain-containing protein [Herbaspirillum rhizosphaerae]|uniref:DUF2917 domain-containing protein n=1 Tax=Herbaspirillum rhizosphaerae TaxID=346179 RepID=UPI00067C855E|nr:DUF2917 domain-containing protein [Herbaspirillum rhizosphaerae]